MLHLDWLASCDDTHAFGDHDTLHVYKTRRREPCTMLAFRVSTSVVKDVEEPHIESHRLHGCKARIIEDTTHNIKASSWMDRRPHVPERVRRVLWGEHLQQGA